MYIFIEKKDYNFILCMSVPVALQKKKKNKIQIKSIPVF